MIFKPQTLHQHHLGSQMLSHRMHPGLPKPFYLTGGAEESTSWTVPTFTQALQALYLLLISTVSLGCMIHVHMDEREGGLQSKGWTTSPQSSKS